MYELYDFGPSPYCLKVRAIFDYKGLPYRRIDIRGAGWLALKRRSPTGMVPGLAVDGRFLTDSTRIAHLLEERHPDPAILSDDPVERARCHVLEDWADESLYWYGLYYRWQHAEGRRTAGVAFPRGTQALASWLVGRGARVRLVGQGIARKPPAMVAAELDVHLERIAALLTDSWLLGEHPRLCDFAVAAQLFYISRTPWGGPRVERHSEITEYLARFRGLRTREKASQK